MVPLLAAGCQAPLKFLTVGLYDNIGCKNGSLDITSLEDVVTIIANIIRLLLVFGGFLAVLMVIVGGIMYIMSTGEPAKISRAKSVISNAIIGLIVALSAFAIVSTISGVFS